MNIKRQPRPFNYTRACQIHQSKKTKKTKKAIAKYLIALLINNELQLYVPAKENVDREYILSIDDLVRISGIKRTILLEALNQEAEQGNLGNLDEIQMGTRAVAKGLFFKALEASHRAGSWGTELMNLYAEYRDGERRGNPVFAAKEVTSALGHELAAQNNLLAILSKLPGLMGMVPNTHKSQVEVHNHITQANANLAANHTETNALITTEMAIKLLTQTGQNLPANPQELWLQYNLSDTPEVTANIQDAQGRNNLNPKDLAWVNHENRRTEELGIIEE